MSVLCAVVRGVGSPAPLRRMPRGFSPGEEVKVKPLSKGEWLSNVSGGKTRSSVR